MLNEVNNNAQSIALNAALSTEETAAEHASSELSSIFMESIEEQNSSAASAKSESMLKSICKPRVLIPLAAVTTGTALAILAYQYGMLEKIWPKEPEPVKSIYQRILGVLANPASVSLNDVMEQIYNTKEVIANTASGALEKAVDAKEYVVKTVADNADSISNAASIALKTVFGLTVTGGLTYGAYVRTLTAINNLNSLSFVVRRV